MPSRELGKAVGRTVWGGRSGGPFGNAPFENHLDIRVQMASRQVSLELWEKVARSPQLSLDFESSFQTLLIS